MITNRDIEIFKFVNKYGKTYIEVLAKTFFTNEQVARNRINTLAKQNLISYWNTNLMKPRRAIVLTADTKVMLEDEFEIKGEYLTEFEEKILDHRKKEEYRKKPS